MRKNKDSRSKNQEHSSPQKINNPTMKKSKYPNSVAMGIRITPPKT